MSHKPKSSFIFRIILLLMISLHSVDTMSADEKPFAEKHLVLQISDADPSKQNFVLNVASNVIKEYGLDAVEVEIVAFGPGLKLLLADNEQASRIDSLYEQSGIRFAACENTLRSMTQKLGKEPPLNPHATKVSAGVVRIMDLVDQGYTLVKP